jgi:hypothetical protein
MSSYSGVGASFDLRVTHQQIVGSPSGPELACKFYVLDRLMHPLILGKPFIAQATAHTVLHDHRLGPDASFLYNSNEGSCLQRFGFSAAFKLG